MMRHLLITVWSGTVFFGCLRIENFSSVSDTSLLVGNKNQALLLVEIELYSDFVTSLLVVCPIFPDKKI